MSTKPADWKIKTPPAERELAKRLEIRTDTRSGVRVWVDNDDVTPKDAAMVARAIQRLPRLLAMERIVKEMFDEGVLDPFPTSDASNEYRLRILTNWHSRKR